MRVFIFLFLFFSNVVLSQTITLHGFIKDIDSGETLIGATLYEKTTGTVVISNEYGFYSISLPIDTLADISVSYVGYSSLEKYIACIKNQNFDFFLQPNNLIGEVVIKASKEKPIEKRIEMSVIDIPIKEVMNLPALGGETDIIKALQLMPGIQSGNEGSSQLYVRGGSPDQNLILLDDIPLYYVNHLGGFISVFNTDAIKNTKIIKGGFPARYGSRLSSIIDIRMKDGNTNFFQGKTMIGLIASKISIEGPIKKDTTSYIISARRMLYDFILRPISYYSFDKKASIGYHFYDFNAKLNHRFSEKDRLYLSIYSGNDKLGFTSYRDDGKLNNNNKWGNKLIAIRWNHLFNRKLFSNMSLSNTFYRFLSESSNKMKRNGEKLSGYNSFKSAINDTKFKMDVTDFIGPKYTLRFGTDITFHNFSPGITSIKQHEIDPSLKDTVFGNYKLRSTEGVFYLENEIGIGENFSANLGLRYNSYFLKRKNFHTIEPRVLFVYLISQNSSIKIAYSKMQQNVHLLTSTGMGMPVDLWLPSTQKAIPENSEQWVFGFAKSILNNQFDLSLEAYYKEMNNLIAYKEGVSYFGSTVDWQEKVETDGKGVAYGVELLIRKKRGNITGWLSYTWANSNRQFENINRGKNYPFKYDRRHDISIVLNRKISDKIDLSATWVYGSGNAYTLAVGKYESINNISLDDAEQTESEPSDDIYIYENRNNRRMRDYHRLDVGFNFHKQKKHGERIWNISIYNAYNRQNPYYYFFDSNAEYDSNGEIIEGTDKMVLKQQSLFPVIPSVSYSYSF
jgi:hypothetical protein